MEISSPITKCIKMAGARSGASALVSAGQKFEKAEAEKLKSWSRKQGKKKTKKSRKKSVKKA